MNTESTWHLFIQRSVLCWLATADAHGQTNVSPKEVFAAFDEQRLVIAHIASPISLRNIQQNPKVCVSLIDIFVQKGWKLIGQAHEILAPSYRFYPDSTTEEGQMDGAMKVYGVRPIP